MYVAVVVSALDAVDVDVFVVAVWTVRGRSFVIGTQGRERSDTRQHPPCPTRVCCVPCLGAGS